VLKISLSSFEIRQNPKKVIFIRISCPIGVAFDCLITDQTIMTNLTTQEMCDMHHFDEANVLITFEKPKCEE